MLGPSHSGMHAWCTAMILFVCWQRVQCFTPLVCTTEFALPSGDPSALCLWRLRLSVRKPSLGPLPRRGARASDLHTARPTHPRDLAPQGTLHSLLARLSTRSSHSPSHLRLPLNASPLRLRRLLFGAPVVCLLQCFTLGPF